MKRIVGTTARGLRTPIITEGDDIIEIVVETVLDAARIEGFTVQDKDIISITESVIARAQGNYAQIDDIAKEVAERFGEDTVGVVFPILSRNRFAPILRGIVRGAKKTVLLLRYPADEVGNSLIDTDQLEQANINPWSDVLSVSTFRAAFGFTHHLFTGVDYVEFYESILSEQGKEYEILFSNNARTILDYTKNVIAADVHSRLRTKKKLIENGGRKVYGLDEFLNTPAEGRGYNEEYGLLGANVATDEKIKLFPRACRQIVDGIQRRLREATGKTVEVMIYGDGAFKDPVGGIWELADPVVSPAFTAGLGGTPQEVKLKYLADKNFADLRGEELRQAVTTYLNNKETLNLEHEALQGTTPRRIVDLLGSLSDLTSGSGDKGTPVVYIQGYFDNYAR